MKIQNLSILLFSAVVFFVGFANIHESNAQYVGYDNEYNNYPVYQPVVVAPHPLVTAYAYHPYYGPSNVNVSSSASYSGAYGGSANWQHSGNWNEGQGGSVDRSGSWDGAHGSGSFSGGCSGGGGGGASCSRSGSWSGDRGGSASFSRSASFHR